MTSKTMRGRALTGILAFALIAGTMEIPTVSVFADGGESFAAAATTNENQSQEGSAPESGDTPANEGTGDPTDPAPTGDTETPATNDGTESTSSDEGASDASDPATDSGSDSSEASGQDDVSKIEDPESTPEESSEDVTEDASEPASAEEPSSEESKEEEPAASGDEDAEDDADNDALQHMEDDGTGPGSNADLIALQNIIEQPVIVEDFRFWTVARDTAFAKRGTDVLEEKKEDARVIGTLEKDDVCYLLKEEPEYYYVESGTVRGFVKKDDLKTGAVASTILSMLVKDAEGAEDPEAEVEASLTTAEELIPASENEAFDYFRATVNRTVIRKRYALSVATDLGVREEPRQKARLVGTMDKKDLCFVIKDHVADLEPDDSLTAEEQEFVYVESGDVRGFVRRKYLEMARDVEGYVLEKGEEEFSLAREKVEPKDNKALYYTITSVKSGVPGGKIRDSLINFASQFVGNPYVWGGTSLTNGADCSGFVQSIYREYDVELPRTSAEQSEFGTQIEIKDAKPGDLIFYAKQGKVYHVVIYAGDGRTVEAANSKAGIIYGKVNKSRAVWATRVLEDTETSSYLSEGGYGTVNVSEDMYGRRLGNFKLTFYCNCSICCGKWAGGPTATGTPVIEGRTIAVDPGVIPYGTQVIINGHVYVAEDCGSSVKGNHIDIYVSDHARCNALGVQYADVYLVG